jgi:tRNA nucleotidyltransferase/poly(A) polymerase
VSTIACLHQLQTQLRCVQAHWPNLYAVGGTVRDILHTGQVPADCDLVLCNTNRDFNVHTLAVTLAQTFNGTVVVLDEAWGIVRVVCPAPKSQDGESSPSLTYDLAQALNNDLAQDLARRDLTMNAMALHLATGELLDPLGGQADLAHRQLRLVSKANVVEDPLRLLRVFRFAASLGFEITADTTQTVRQHQDLLWQAAPERLQAEWLKLLSAPTCTPALMAMADSGLLEVLLPELSAGRDIPPNGYHHLSLWDHTLELVRQAEQVIGLFSDETRQALLQPSPSGVSRFGLVKLACLLHDIGKPATKATRDDGRYTYYGHDQVSETMSLAICQRLKLSNKQTDAICHLVRWHLYPCQFNPASPQKSLLRFYRRMGQLTPDLILLALADRLSATGGDQTAADLTRETENHLWLLSHFEALCAAQTLNQPPLLNGQAVMAILGLPPGPKVGAALAALCEAQQLGEVQTIEQASTWLRQQATLFDTQHPSVLG